MDALTIPKVYWSRSQGHKKYSRGPNLYCQLCALYFFYEGLVNFAGRGGYTDLNRSESPFDRALPDIVQTQQKKSADTSTSKTSSPSGGQTQVGPPLAKGSESEELKDNGPGLSKGRAQQLTLDTSMDINASTADPSAFALGTSYPW